MKLLGAFVLSFFSLSFLPTLAPAFTDAEFEATVTAQNAELRVLAERRKALANGAEEADLLYSWQLTAGLNKRWDEKPRVDPSFTYDSFSTLGAQIGFEKRTKWGLETKLSFDARETEILGGRAGPAAFNLKVWETAPSIEFKFPLLAGGFGRKIRADYDLLSTRKKIEALRAEAEYDQKLNEARTILWSTILQKKSLEHQQDTFSRIKEIYQIVQGKTSQNLEASSNFLQTRAALEQAELELQLAKLKFEQFERLLKLVLSQTPNLQLPEYDFTKFEPVSLTSFIDKVTAPEKLRSLDESAARFAAISSFEEIDARLDLIASYTANGQNEKLPEALGQSQRLRYPTRFVGLLFSAPLDFGIAGRARVRQEQLAKLAAERQLYFQTELRTEQKKDLVSQYNQYANLLTSNLRLEKTQGEKLKNERKLLRQGRSSIYQVLQFELDFSRAQSGKFQLALELEKLQQQLALNKYTTYE